MSLQCRVSGTHLDAVQGSSEARNKAYKWYGDVSTGAADAVIRQKQARCNGLAPLAGACDA